MLVVGAFDFFVSKSAKRLSKTAHLSSSSEILCSGVLGGQVKVSGPTGIGIG